MMNIDELRHVGPFVIVKTLGGQACHYNHPDLLQQRAEQELIVSHHEQSAALLIWSLYARGTGIGINFW